MGSRGAGSRTAVFFMGEKGVSIQMLFSEFEALLDGLGAMSDYADQ